VILHFSERLASTSIAAREASSVYNIEMSSMYKSIGIPSLWRLRMGLAWDSVN